MIDKFSLSDALSDTEGGTSSKRVAFFIFVLAFVILILGTIAALWVSGAIPPAVINFVNGCLDKILEAIKWLGGFIAVDKAPSIARAISGTEKKDPPFNPEPADIPGATKP